MMFSRCNLKTGYLINQLELSTWQVYSSRIRSPCQQAHDSDELDDDGRERSLSGRETWTEGGREAREREGSVRIAKGLREDASILEYGRRSGLGVASVSPALAQQQGGKEEGRKEE